MTPNSCLSALIARLNAADFKECKSPNGLTDGGSARLDKGFYVRPLSISFMKGRNRSEEAGARVNMAFEVQLGHKVKPSDGCSAAATALTDVHTALRYLFTPNTTLTSGGGGAIFLGQIKVDYMEGGSYIIQKVKIDIHFNLSLFAP